jgi:hypothetical protein
LGVWELLLVVVLWEVLEREEEEGVPNGVYVLLKG